MQQLEEYLEKIVDMHVLIIGDSMLDRYVQGSVTRISPEAPVPVLKMNSIEMKLGGAANVAQNIQSIGARASLISVIGDDQAGQHFRASMEQAGLNTDYLIETETGTTVKTRIMSGSQHILRVDEEEVTTIANHKQEQITRFMQQLVENDRPDVIILQDYNKGLFSEKLITKILETGHQNRIPVCVDPKFDHFLAFKRVHIFKPNLVEVQRALPMTIGSDLPSLDNADRYLREKLNHEITIITLGKHGVYLNDGTHSCIVKTEPRAIVDVCGAGDAVIGSVALTSGSTLPLKFIGRIANTAGGLVCEQVGVASIPKGLFIRELLKNVK
jgi:rfaE bifunctional protein kinase chain/domain